MLASRIPWGVAALAVFLFSCGAIASAQEHRFEVSINTGHANPPFVFQGPEPFRAPPPSVVRQRPERQFHVRPAPTPFFGPIHDVSETVRRQATTVSILQSVDLVGRGRVRPWLARGHRLRSRRRSTADDLCLRRRKPSRLPWRDTSRRAQRAVERHRSRLLVVYHSSTRCHRLATSSSPARPA